MSTLDAAMTPVSAEPPSVLMAPMNFADQPMSLVRALRHRGMQARQLNYSADGLHPLGYALDWAVQIDNLDDQTQLDVLQQCLDSAFEIYHFWQRSLVFNRDLDGLTGIDLPILKASGATIFHRFTGLDLRMSREDCEFNPYSPFKYGFASPFDEHRQRAYIDFLSCYVDRFFVQDPELKQFMPDATVLPRGLALEQWPKIGIERTDRPLIVHAPTNPAVKGSRQIISALESLRHENLSFDFKILNGISHAEARSWYERADIVVDQILIGATGVLTLEAWALGKPCVTYLREDLFNPFYDTTDLAVANANPDTIEDTLRRLIKDNDWRENLSSAGRETVEKYHDIAKIAAEYEKICREHSRPAQRGGQSAEPAAFLRSGVATQNMRTPASEFARVPLVRNNPGYRLLATIIRGQEWVFARLIQLQIRLSRAVIHLTQTARRMLRRKQQ